MTPQEAIDFIECEVQIDVRFCSDKKVDKTIEVFELAISALEKQIPKKPNLWCGKIITCPNCLRAISQTEALDVHCKYCGQFIDWSDTDG